MTLEESGDLERFICFGKQSDNELEHGELIVNGLFKSRGREGKCMGAYGFSTSRDFGGPVSGLIVLLS